MYLLLAISALVLLLLVQAVRGRSAQVKDPHAAGELIIPVDLEAFRNLIDAQQDRFLREHLDGRDYRRVQRARALATAEYLRHVAHNAGIILRVGEFARSSREASVAALGAELVSNAIRLRLFSLVALAQAYLSVVLPGLSLSAGGVADRYDMLTAKLWAVGRSWTPTPGASAAS